MYTYGLFMLMYGRNEISIVFQLKINFKKVASNSLAKMLNFKQYQIFGGIIEISAAIKDVKIQG